MKREVVTCDWRGCRVLAETVCAVCSLDFCGVHLDILALRLCETPKQPTELPRPGRDAILPVCQECFPLVNRILQGEIPGPERIERIEQELRDRPHDLLGFQTAVDVQQRLRRTADEIAVRLRAYWAALALLPKP